MGLIKILKSWFGADDEPRKTSRAAAELRDELRARYHQFKLLLTSANRFLSVMGDMEQALRENRVFGSTYVRAEITAATVNVYRIIQHLDAIRPNTYGELFVRLGQIKAELEGVLEQRAVPECSSLVLPIADLDLGMTDQAGAKMASLGEIRRRLPVLVPDGFVVTTLGYRRLLDANDLQPEIDRRLQLADIEDQETLFSLSAELQGLITQASVPDELGQAIMEAYGNLAAASGRQIRVSMRASAVGEESAGASFAGQFRTCLNIDPDDILETYKEIVASKYSLAAMNYRLFRGIPDEDVAMCVGCMAMIDARAGGVLYSRNPLDVRDRSIFISSTWGLPKTVADGTADTDLFVVDGEKEHRLTRRTIRTKRTHFACNEGDGICRIETSGALADTPSIDDETALALARLATDLDGLLDTAVDVEWAQDKTGQLSILQCRPLRRLELDPARLAREMERDDDAFAVVRGLMTASPGVGAGPVCIVKSDLDLLRFPDGGVLVSPEAQTRWSSVIPRAAAVVTEAGSTAGNLANIAREFHIPALFEARGAAQVLSEGRVVTVDADGRRVLEGRDESLLAAAAKEREAFSMLDTPVARQLQAALKHIAPLTLPDTDDPGFRARNCRTCHDLVVYSHERAINEMFNVYDEFETPEFASKQLVTDAPMQWWVLNLDDGFKHEIKGKFIRLAEVDCAPMLAIWEGISAFPWEGPPPVDGRGLLAIMYQSATNPELEGPASANFLVKNRFMISKNFVTLSSRFGYHFTTIEALVGERESENYLCFQFKGGATEFERRQRRAFFVADILKEWGFKVDVDGDAAFARIEGQGPAYMLGRLKILGYLIIHTRQLDMIMKLRDEVERYKNKLMAEIGVMLDSDAQPAA